jgi:hypothetical protein
MARPGPDRPQGEEGRLGLHAPGGREAGAEYLDYKRGKGKRSIRQDEQILAKLKARLGADASIVEITAQRIAQYERDRVVEKSKLGRLVTPSTVNRELAILRHLLRLAEELTWERVDFARGVLQLEHTKSGRRREVPMN